MELFLWKKSLYLFFLANLSVILFFWWSGNSSMIFAGGALTLLASGKLFGLLAVLSVLLQFVLIGRAIWVERAFGLDKLARVHHLNGHLAILLVLLHPIFITISYAMSAKVSVVTQFLEFFNHYEDVNKAAIGVAILLLTVGLSIYIVRRRLKYELWYYVHLLNYVAVALVWGHQLKLGGDFGNQMFVAYWYGLYAFVFGNLILFRFIRPWFNFYLHRFTVAKLVPETKDATSVYIGGQNIDQFKIKPGQFMIFRFLGRGFWWQAHPFSLSYVPKNGQLRATIKNSGDFTSTIPSLPVGTPVVIDGPYGIFYPNSKSEILNSKYLFIAGGVGITPIRALVEQLASNANLVLLYNSRTSSDFIFKKELDDLSQKFKFPVYYVASEDEKFLGEKGRIDAEKIQRLVKDFKEREIYICGPPPMMDSVIAILKSLGVSKKQIHFEKFSL